MLWAKHFFFGGILTLLSGAKTVGGQSLHLQSNPFFRNLEYSASENRRDFQLSLEDSFFAHKSTPFFTI
jgi:hypothetical protein